MRMLVLGGGLQGSAAAFDLLRTEGVQSVVVADRPGFEAPAFLVPHVGRKLRIVALDASDRIAARAAMEDVDAVVCALPYFFNYEMSELAILAGAHFCDLGGNTEIVERQRTLDARARAARVSV